MIASGGVGTLQHMVEGEVSEGGATPKVQMSTEEVVPILPVRMSGGADAVLAASIFHFGEHTVADAKRVLAANNVTVRPPELIFDTPAAFIAWVER